VGTVKGNRVGEMWFARGGEAKADVAGERGMKAAERGEYEETV